VFWCHMLLVHSRRFETLTIVTVRTWSRLRMGWSAAVGYEWSLQTSCKQARCRGLAGWPGLRLRSSSKARSQHLSGVREHGVLHARALAGTAQLGTQQEVHHLAVGVQHHLPAHLKWWGTPVATSPTLRHSTIVSGPIRRHKLPNWVWLCNSA